MPVEPGVLFFLLLFSCKHQSCGSELQQQSNAIWTRGLVCMDTFRHNNEMFSISRSKTRLFFTIATSSASPAVAVVFMSDEIEARVGRKIAHVGANIEKSFEFCETDEVERSGPSQGAGLFLTSPEGRGPSRRLRNGTPLFEGKRPSAKQNLVGPIASTSTAMTNQSDVCVWGH